jgi:hypothetical protein
LRRVRHHTLAERQGLKQLGLAFASDVDTLYKFRSFVGASRKRVFDIIKTSRIYCARARIVQNRESTIVRLRRDGSS